MASRRLLLVEDSSTMRRILSANLSDKGYAVETANDGLQGLAKARLDPRPELILTDYEMPELDGAGLCQALKADKELRSLPVLMLTTLGEAQSKIAGLTAGADDYIEKPKGEDDFLVLYARIEAHLRIADLRGRTGRSQPAARGGPQEADLRAQAGAEGPARPDASSAQATGRAAAGRTLYAGE